MRYLCNPMNIEYKYQFCRDREGNFSVNREAADPSMILFKGRYYIYPSMTCGFWYSDDLEEWNFHLLKDMPVYDYAPDVRVVGDYIYFCASNHEHGTHYRTKDPFSDQYERFDGDFPFWDPNLFCDEDGRLYFYWGSSPEEPIYGIELDAETLKPIGERVPLIYRDEEQKGFERRGENHVPKRSKEEIAAMLAGLEQQEMPEAQKAMARAYLSDNGYIEGAWMNKHKGIYYLQYGTPGAQFNTYNDGVYVSEEPLGPFKLAENNPFSYKPGGFFPGAGHGSTMEDKEGAFWHIATMRISKNHVFERRIGLWPTGFDADGEMYCNQRYGDWVYDLDTFRKNPWANPKWMLLSYGKTVTASSTEQGYDPKSAVDENVQTWWRAAKAESGEWLQIDLGKLMDVHAVQINFADDKLVDYVTLPEEAKLVGDIYSKRWIDVVHQPTRWILEGSVDGREYFVIEDKSDVTTDLSHDLVVSEAGVAARYIRLTVIALPYGQPATVSGLRIFGTGEGEKPTLASDIVIERTSNLDINVSWHGNGTGYVVEWGYAPDKLYHSYQTFENRVHLGGLVKGQEIYVRVDSFNEAGITEGEETIQVLP